ncbi:MAG: secretin N-terminal domain-containing protein [Burkholderiales bacterium]
MRAALALGLALGAVPARAEAALEVIPLHYRTAEEVIPVLRPMLAPEGTLSGFKGQLIVRTTPENLAEIKRILASLDSAPRQLLITVRQDADLDRQRSTAGVSGSVGGENARVTVPPASRERYGGSVVLREGDNRVRAHVLESSSAGTDRNTQTLRVLEGREAFIRAGQSVPVRGRQVTRTVVGGQVVEQVVDTTQYRDVTTGFYVRARVSGDRVVLEVSPQRETLSQDIRGGVNVQRVVTTVAGRLGEWMELGGVGQTSTAEQSVLLGRASSATRDDRRVLIKVEEIR